MPRIPKDDLSQKQFGDLKVIKYAGKGKWLCRCSCGAEVEKLTTHLTGGYVKSCGNHNGMNNKFIDMKDKIFGELKVIDYDKDEGKWLCRCSCDKQILVRGWDLRNGKKLMCSDCLTNHNRNKLEDSIIGGFKVIEYLGSKQYKCKCLNCNNIYSVFTENLKNNKYGCEKCSSILKMKYKLQNKQIGELHVKEYLGNSRWKCKCSCGNEYIATTNYLVDATKNKRCNKCYINSKIVDMKGKVVGDWNILEYVGKQQWKVQCRHCNKIYTRFGWNLRVFRSSICPCNKSSKPELELYSHIKSIYNGEIIQGDRKILSGKEIDIYIPSHKLAIEFNGIYWHSTRFKDKYYHQNKTIECAKKNIRLIHIFEHEWEDLETREKIINLLSNILCEDVKTIYARNTEIKQLSNKDCNDFLDMYHLQNSTNASIKLGCYYKDELIGVLTLGKPRFNNNYEYEIHRLCWKNGIKVVGGTERMFNYFIKNYNPNNILTYTDISKFTGKVYMRLGFKPIQPNPITEPNYAWVTNTSQDIFEILPRYQTQKHKLIELGLGSEEQTEDEIMESLGYSKVYDSGNIRLEWRTSGES